jgi:cyclic-di-GMP-binding biofilm dispersal mediator protein
VATQPIDVTDARVLVLGGSGALGSAIAAELKRRGAVVMLAGRDPQRLHQRATELGPDVPSVLFDLTDPTHASHVIDTAVTHLGGLDGLVNAAGLVAFGPLSDITDHTLDEIVAADLVGPLRVMRAALPHLEGGFIVSISGVVAETPVAGMAPYAAAKAGLSAATRALGKELRRKGIHVLDARPPHTETGLAGRPIAGAAPSMPEGLDPHHVARTIVDGLAASARELPATAFTAG